MSWTDRELELFILAPMQCSKIEAELSGSIVASIEEYLSQLSVKLSLGENVIFL